jgi:DNA-binding NarL/FixJ family response regulator
MLQEEPGLEVVGEAVDANELFTLTEEAAANLIMMDKKLPGFRMKELISRLHALESKPIVIVMSSNSEDSRKVLHDGADAFVSKGDQPDWLLEILRHYTERAKSLGEWDGESNGDSIESKRS